MNPPLDFADALTQLKLITSQTDNFTFTDDELTQALTESWNDQYNVVQITDDTTQFQPGVFTYSVPTTVSVVRGIFYSPTSTDPLTEIDSRLYQIDNGNIVFVDDVQRWFNDYYTLYVKGSYKLQTTDNLPSTNNINYVINLAAESLLNRLLLKKTFVFLTNDTSMADIVNALKTYTNRVLTAKQGLLRQFETT